MAYIPYGYRIERGLALPDPERAEKLRRCIGLILGGTSLRKAREISGISLSASGLRDCLLRGVYEGDDYYPALLPSGTRGRLACIMKTRSRPGTRKMKEPLSVKKRFVFVPAGTKGSGAVSAEDAEDPVRRTEELYRCIRPATKGRRRMAPEEVRRLRAAGGTGSIGRKQKKGGGSYGSTYYSGANEN